MIRLSDKKFKSIYNEHFDYACRFAWPYLYNQDSVDEVVQSAFIKLYKSLNRFKKEAKLRTYFTRILINTIYDFCKRKKLETEELIETNLAEKEQDEFLDLTLAYKELSLQQLSCLQLYYYGSYSTQSIAELLGISTGSVKTQLSRARAKIKSYLQEQEKTNG